MDKRDLFEKITAHSNVIAVSQALPAAEEEKEKSPRLKECYWCGGSLVEKMTTLDLIKHTLIGQLVAEARKALDRAINTLSPAERYTATYGSIDRLPRERKYDEELIDAIHIPEELHGLQTVLAKKHHEYREAVARRWLFLRRALARMFMETMDKNLSKDAWTEMYRKKLLLFFHYLKE